MIYLLLLVYQLKHFLCDYPLQGRYMLGKFAKYPTFILPLLAHVATHGLATFLIALAVHPGQIVRAALLALFDMVIHFTMDRIKASPDLLGRFKPLTASTYKFADNMAKGLGMASGEDMSTKGLDAKTLEDYKALGRKDLRGNTFFWWSLGLDQAVHHLTHYAIIWELLR